MAIMRSEGAQMASGQVDPSKQLDEAPFEPAKVGMVQSKASSSGHKRSSRETDWDATYFEFGQDPQSILKHTVDRSDDRP
jgi:hypothetical protein